MKQSVPCPSCQIAMGKISQDDVSRMVCSSCQRVYEVLYGKLSGRSSIVETVLYLTAKFPRIYKRHYEFRITTPARSLKVLKFSLAGKADIIPIRQGDLVSILYSTQGYLLEKLVGITNHTTGQCYALPTAIPGLNRMVATRGSVLTMAFISLLVCQVNLLLVTGLILVVSVMWWKLSHVAQLTNPPLSAQVQAEARLMVDQELLNQKAQFEGRVRELHHEHRTNQGLVRQLEALQQRMNQFDPVLYTARIQRIERAMAILQNQSHSIQRLVAEYQQILEMITIEIEASALTDQLPDSEEFTRVILARVEEMRLTEAQNQYFRCQVEANEEVRQLQS